MKHILFFLAWLAMLCFFSLVVGILALLGYPNAEIVSWSGNTIESETGKITWILISAMGLVIFSALTVSRYRRKNH
jgi:NADH:ubiquinone oxidoreductase subunit H